MRFCILALTVAAACAGCAGCTTASLQRYTVSQIHSAADYRSEAALHCLAVVAANPGKLPSFATLADGTTSVKDTATLSATTTWTRAIGGFAMQALAPMAGRSPNELWTVDPVADHTRLEALRCACRWVLYGPEQACADCPGILADPLTDPSPGPHFGVADRLARMPPGWLHVGGLKDVPAHARCKAHCGNTWVWVMPDGTEGFSEFILVLHDIATIDVDFGATTAPPVLVTLVKVRLFTALKLTEGSLDVLRGDKMDPEVLNKLWPLVNQSFDSQEGFVQKLAQVLTEDQMKGVQKKVLDRAQQPDKSFELTDAALASLAQEIKDKALLDKLRTLKNKRIVSREGFSQALAGALTEDQLKGVQGKVLKQAQQANLPYSKQLNYSDIRVIEPGFVAEVADRISEATAAGQRVQITWEEWQAHTKPYHGTRSNIKPDGVQPVPQALPSRGFPPGTLPPASDWFLRTTILEQGPPVKSPAPSP